ncbi:MAG: hypothetical protein H0U73_07905 [Tatlockia sp.]|nr:hypothetical protein [Tatlockia sp.]
MTREVKATGDGACLFNAIAIALSVKILNDEVDKYKNSLGYQQLIEQFARHHPNFKPKDWNTLKTWLRYYNNYRDLELILSPVLLKLCQSDPQYQAKFEVKILDELTNLIRNEGNKDLILRDEFYRLNTTNCSNIDALSYKDKSSVLNELKPIITKLNLTQDFKDLKKQVKAKAYTELNKILGLIKTNPKAFQAGFSTGDIKGMAASLSLNISENVAEYSEKEHASQDKILIRLKNEQEHWDVLCDDQEIGVIDTKYRYGKLSMTSDNAHSCKVGVLSPLDAVKAKEREKSHNKTNLSEIVEDSVKPDDLENEAILLKELQLKVQKATAGYLKYNKEECYYSIFHVHGETGRLRAEGFQICFAKIDNYADAKRVLFNYLKDPKNGNTYPHSYRTMLLDKLLRESATKLKDTSDRYDLLLEMYEKPAHTATNQCN